MDFAHSVRAAFQSWWTLFGILAASLTAFNLLRKLINLGLGEALARIFAAYQHWIHEPIVWVAGMLGLTAPPAIAIDMALLWLLIGGVVLRSGLALTQSMTLHRKGFASPQAPVWTGLLQQKNRILFVLFCIALWPFAIGQMLTRPHIYRHIPRNVIIAYDKRRYPEPEEIFVCDLRIVLLTQTLAVAACVAAWIFVNELVG